MLWLALALMLSASAAPDRSDQRVRAALRQAVARLEQGESNPKQFERRLPRSNVPTWQRLQKQTPGSRSGSADLAFILAYYGVDYHQNLRRLLLPYHRWRRTLARPSASASTHDEAVVESLPSDLEILYRKHRDPESLGLLLDMQSDGAVAEEQVGALQELWQGHAVTMLRAAAGSPVRLGNLADMLGSEAESAADRKASVAEVRKFTHHPDARVRQAAAKLTFLLKAVYSR